MPSYIRLGIRILYQSKLNKFGLGRSSIKQLLQNLSMKQGKKFDDPNSAKRFFFFFFEKKKEKLLQLINRSTKFSILPFIKFHNLSVEEVLDPLESFKNFNEFFYRKLKPEARPLGSTDPVCFLFLCFFSFPFSFL